MADIRWLFDPKYIILNKIQIYEIEFVYQCIELLKDLCVNSKSHSEHIKEENNKLTITRQKQNGDMTFSNLGIPSPAGESTCHVIILANQQPE